MNRQIVEESMFASPSERAVMKQHAEREVPSECEEILAAGFVAHAGFVLGNQPFVIPLSYHYNPSFRDKIYLHGSTHSRAMHALASGSPVCLTVTVVDGLVYSKTAKYHSMNYRSVVCFGKGNLVENSALKAALFDSMIARYFPGREAGKHYETAPASHLATTLLVEVTIEEMTAKARRGGPKGPTDSLEDSLGTSGVVPLSPYY
jgi:uncharacterized protein